MLITKSPILVVNTGSSTLKLGLYASRADGVELLLEGLGDGVGKSRGKLEVRNAAGDVLRSESLALATQRDALRAALPWVHEFSNESPGLIGHRVVHGGPHLVQHQQITPDLVAELKASVHFAPLHIPLALDLIEEAGCVLPGVTQFACFDTAFHRTLPEPATRFPIRRELFDEGIRRYGFHGLSYESIVRQLGTELRSRTVVAHLGSGASLAALRDGVSVDTTMGLTPTGGIPMATRTGDIDPGVLLYLLRERQLTPDSLEDLLNHAAGLKAISGGSGDMRDLEATADAGDQKAQIAIQMFCRAVSKTVAAYAAVLGGLDMLVFSGGIGEHSQRVREQVCHDLGFLGMKLDDAANRSHGAVISTPSSQVEVRVVPSEEDVQIAHHCRMLLQE